MQWQKYLSNLKHKSQWSNIHETTTTGPYFIIHHEVPFPPFCRLKVIITSEKHFCYFKFQDGFHERCVVIMQIHGKNEDNDVG